MKWECKRRRKGVAAILGILFVPCASYAQSASGDDERVQLELAAMDKRGEIIARAREQTFTILETENGCSAWFREVEPDPEDVFRSIQFEIDKKGSPYIFRMRERHGLAQYKHPWAARTIENGGRSSVVWLNANGAFFNRTSQVLIVDQDRSLVRSGGGHALVVASFSGNTTQARITILLHELGHIVGRIPQDDDSWDGRSTQNTAEVLRHCLQEIHAAAKRNFRAANESSHGFGFIPTR